MAVSGNNRHYIWPTPTGRSLVTAERLPIFYSTFLPFLFSHTHPYFLCLKTKEKNTYIYAHLQHENGSVYNLREKKICKNI